MADIYKNAWIRLSQVFGEDGNTEALELMDNVMKSAEFEEDENQKEGANGIQDKTTI